MEENRDSLRGYTQGMGMYPVGYGSHSPRGLNPHSLVSRPSFPRPWGPSESRREEGDRLPSGVETTSYALTRSPLHPAFARAQDLFHAQCSGRIRSIHDTRPCSLPPLEVGSLPPVPDLSKATWEIIPSPVKAPSPPPCREPSSVEVPWDVLLGLEASAVSSIRACSILLSAVEEMATASPPTRGPRPEGLNLMVDALADLSQSLVTQSVSWESFQRFHALESPTRPVQTQSVPLDLPRGPSFGSSPREALAEHQAQRASSLYLGLDESWALSHLAQSAAESFESPPPAPPSSPPPPVEEPLGIGMGDSVPEGAGQALPPPPSPSETPLPGTGLVPDSVDSLNPRAAQWEALNLAPWLLSVIKSGFRLMWKDSPPPLASTPLHFPPPHDMSAYRALSEEVEALCIKGAVEQVPNPSSGFYGRLFCVPKASGGWRPVLDLSVLNKFLVERPFQMETTQSIRQAVKQGDWASSIDLTDAYFHVRIHPRCRRFLRFTWQGKTYQFKVLPFGLSLAPWVFTKIVMALASSLHMDGIRIHVYLDDWLILAQQQALCRRHTHLVLQKAKELGFRVNEGKSDLEPSQVFVFLGVRFCTISMRVSPSLERITKLQEDLSKSSVEGSFATARRLHAFIGQMESMSSLVPGGRVHKRPLQAAVRSRWAQASQSWSTRIKLGPWFSEAVSQWFVTDWALSGVSMTPPDPTVTLYTDASIKGWGGHIGDQVVAGDWLPADMDHINVLEMEAVHRCLIHFLPLVQNQSVLLLSDNLTVVCYLNKQGGTRSPRLCSMSLNILQWCDEHGVVLIAKHLAGALNIVADQLSRSDQILPSEWSISSGILSQVWSHFGDTPHVDMFATCFNFKLPTYVSPVRDDSALFQDAFSRSWKGLFFYAFPPFTMIGKVIFKVRKDRPKCILVLPWWPSKFWWPYLMGLSSRDPLPLDISSRWALVQPRSGVPHGNKEFLRLHAWFIEG